jgi:hypothetical protein
VIIFFIEFVWTDGLDTSVQPVPFAAVRYFHGGEPPMSMGWKCCFLSIVLSIPATARHGGYAELGTAHSPSRASSKYHVTNLQAADNVMPHDDDKHTFFCNICHIA